MQQEHQSEGMSDNEELQEDEEMDMFSENSNVAFVRSLLKLQGQIIHLPNSKEHFDIYLAQ